MAVKERLIVVQSSLPSNKKANLSTSFEQLDLNTEVTNCLVKSVAYMGLPIRLFDRYNFRRAFEFLKFEHLPSSEKVSDQLIPLLVNSAKKNMELYLAAAPDHSITIEFDGWKDLNKHHIWG